jgi:hypothetical protein
VDIQLGRSKTVRRAYGIDEIALVPGGRTVDPEVTDTRWTLGGIEREIPIIASAMDGVVDVGMAVRLSQLGALGVLNLEGVQTRYEDPNQVLDRIAAVGKDEFVPLMQQIYSQPVQEALIRKRIKTSRPREASLPSAAHRGRHAFRQGHCRSRSRSLSSCRPPWSQRTTPDLKAKKPWIWKPFAATWAFPW